MAQQIGHKKCVVLVWATTKMANWYLPYVMFARLKEIKMKTKKVLSYVLVGLLGGCVPVMSLHPLFTEQDVIFEEKLLGKWVDDVNSPNSIWEFSRIDSAEKADEKAYKLVLSDKEGKKGLFTAHLVKLEGKLFLDVHPGKPPWETEDPNKVQWEYNTVFFLPVHSFVRVGSIGPELKMRITDDEKMKEFLKEEPKAVGHEMIDDAPILTATTKELQKFVLKYADNEKVFCNEVTLKRK
jgi:hypothetical protein